MSKKILMAILSILLVSAGSGCAARQTPAPVPQGYSATPNNVAKNVSKTVMPPRQIAVLQSNAEDILSDIDNKDWTKVNSRVKQIRTSHNQLKPLMTASAVPANTASNLENTVLALEKQVNAKNAYETKVQANKMTRILPDIADMYKMIVPADLARIGYHCRETSLNAEKRDWTAAVTNVKSTRTMWDRLKYQLNSTYRADVAGFTKALDNLGKAVANKNHAAVKTNAKRLADALAVIQTDFLKQSTSK